MTALRVAVLAESETDDAVAREVVAHVRFEVVDSVPVPSLRARGWPAMLQQLPAVVRTVYYTGDANALVILADTDHEAPHDPSTHTPDTPYPGCRWCLLHGALTREIQKLGARPMGIPLWTAIGTPMPAVEA